MKLNSWSNYPYRPLQKIRGEPPDIIFKQLWRALHWGYREQDRTKAKIIREYLERSWQFSSKPKNINQMVNIMTYSGINFFVPFWFRYRVKEKSKLQIKDGDPEKVLLLKLKEKYDALIALWLEGKIQFMYADDYVVELNDVWENESKIYLSSLKDVITEVFGSENEDWNIFLSSDLYNTKKGISGNGITKEELLDIIWREKWDILLKQSKKMNPNKNKEYITERAFLYAKKRLEEAFYVQNLLGNVIKISPVAPSLNDKLDMNMPTLYFFGQEEEAPWMKVTD